MAIDLPDHIVESEGAYLVWGRSEVCGHWDYYEASEAELVDEGDILRTIRTHPCGACDEVREGPPFLSRTPIPAG